MLLTEMQSVHLWERLSLRCIGATQRDEARRCNNSDLRRQGAKRTSEPGLPCQNRICQRQQHFLSWLHRNVYQVETEVQKKFDRTDHPTHSPSFDFLGMIHTTLKSLMNAKLCRLTGLSI